MWLHALGRAGCYYVGEGVWYEAAYVICMCERLKLVRNWMICVQVLYTS